MNCKLENENMMKYFDGNLNDIEIAKLKQHLKSCTECNRDFEELDSVLGFLEKESWVEPPDDFEIQVMQRVNSFETTRKRKADSFLAVLYSLVFSMLAVLLAFVVLRIRELDVNAAVQQLSHFTDAFSTVTYAGYSIFDKLAEVIAEMASIVFQVAGDMASSYYYIFIVMLLMLLVIHKALMNILGENGGTTK